MSSTAISPDGAVSVTGMRRRRIRVRRTAGQSVPASASVPEALDGNTAVVIPLPIAERAAGDPGASIAHPPSALDVAEEERAPDRESMPTSRDAARVWREAKARTRDAGMATAEYAVVLLAAVGFAGLLIVILTSAEVREMLTGLVRNALSV